MEKATFQDLLARKLQRENDKLKVKEISIPSMGKALHFKKPSDGAVVDVVGATIHSNDVQQLYEAYKKVIYMTCDTLQNPELHKELGIADPFDVVQALLEPTDVFEVGNQLMEFVGFEQVDEKVKN
jgi:hypothetical protein